MDQRTEWISFAFDQDQDDGEETLTIVWGGSHRGGISQGRISWAGGLDVTRASEIRDLIVAQVHKFIDDCPQGVLDL